MCRFHPLASHILCGFQSNSCSLSQLYVKFSSPVLKPKLVFLLLPLPWVCNNNMDLCVWLAISLPVNDLTSSDGQVRATTWRLVMCLRSLSVRESLRHAPYRGKGLAITSARIVDQWYCTVSIHMPIHDTVMFTHYNMEVGNYSTTLLFLLCYYKSDL